MADAEGARRVQDAHEVCNVAYGHFGTATYDPKIQQWRFLRDDDQSSFPTAAEVGETSVLVRRSPQFSPLSEASPLGEHERIDLTPSAKIAKGGDGTSYILKHFPEAVPALASMFSYVRTSESTLAFPQPSQLLALGYASVVNQRGSHDAAMAMPIVACRTGLTDQSIFIGLVTAQQISWQDGAGVESVVHVPGLPKSHSCSWRTSGEPVLQACFSQMSGQGSTVLAIRTTSMTVLFIPCLTQTHGDKRFDAIDAIDEGSIGLRVVANPVLSIPISRTGGQPHADVTFHPQDPNLVAVIDTHGRWSVWKSKEKNSATLSMLFQAELQVSGRILPSNSDKSSSENYPCFDGWHKVCWLTSEKTEKDCATGPILVCNRRLALQYDSQGELVGHLDTRLGPKASRNWILDFTRSNMHRDLCYALTTQRVMIFAVPKPHDTESQPATLIGSWSHYRGGGDLTLRMSILELQNTACLILSSKLNPEITMFQFTYNAKLPFPSASLRSPTRFALPEKLKVNYHRISDLQLHPIEVDDRGRGVLGGREVLVKLFARFDDGNLFETLYALDDSIFSSAMPGGHESVLALPHIIRMPHESGKHVDGDESHDFVVNDDARKAIAETLSQHALANTFTPAPKRVDWDNVLEFVGDDESRLQINASLEEVDVSLPLALQDGHPVQVLAEMIPKTVITEIEDAAQRLTSWLSSLSKKNHMGSSTNIELVKVGTEQIPTLIGIYNEILHQFVNSLPNDIPARSRVNAERLSRQVALDITLSSVAVRLRPPARVDASASQEESSAIPGVFSQAKMRDNVKEELGLSYEITPRVSTRLLDNPATRLQKYTRFSKTAPLELDSPSVSAVLAHLPVDIIASPSTYSYANTELNLAAARKGLELQNLDPRARRKAEKLEAAKQRRLERQERMTQEIALQQAAAPNIAMSTQPVDRREVQSSQPAWEHESGSVTALVNMTQPERGPHGARNKTSQTGRGKKAKNSRPAGFR